MKIVSVLTLWYGVPSRNCQIEYNAWSAVLNVVEDCIRVKVADDVLSSHVLSTT